MIDKKQEKNMEKWWDAASEYYQEEISADDMTEVHYGPFGSTESRLKLLGDVKNKKILELGCGGGQISVVLAKKGAVCTAIDISANQIDAARKNAEKKEVDVKFLKLPFSALDRIKGERFDIIISVMSIQYCEDIVFLFRQVKRLLGKNGVFVFSVEHPFYLLIDPEDMRIKESYFKTGLKKKKEVWPGNKTHYFSYYDRKISDFTDSIISAGLQIERLLEPFDRRYKIWEVGYRRALVNRIGPTIIFKCKSA